ncbi:MAG: glycosyltransferase family 4 protein, partial [Deltaproteobacteria bacterium]
VLDIAKRVAPDGIRFLLVGEGAEKAKLKERALAEGIENVTFWDQQPRDRVAQIYAASDLCLVLLRDLPLFNTVIPSKIFEFMGAGRPILTTVNGESRGIVERAGAGAFSPPGNAEALVEAVESMRREPDRLAVMGQKGREFVEQHYSRRALAARYLDILGRVARPEGRTEVTQ